MVRSSLSAPFNHSPLGPLFHPFNTLLVNTYPIVTFASTCLLCHTLLKCNFIEKYVVYCQITFGPVSLDKEDPKTLGMNRSLRLVLLKCVTPNTIIISFEQNLFLCVKSIMNCLTKSVSVCQGYNELFNKICYCVSRV